MKKLLCTTVALAALTLSIPAQATAFNVGKADGFNGSVTDSFKGIYLGLQVGHNTTKIDGKYTNILGTGVNEGTDYGASGLELGLVGGCRIKQGQFVFGVEADGMLSNAKSTLANYSDGGGNNIRIEVEKRHSYAIGPRIGYLIMDNTLAFVGVDWTHGNFKSTISGDVTGSGDEGLDGVRFGTGVEVATETKINVRLDYQHTRWDSHIESDGAGGTFSLAPAEDTARIGVVYPF